MSTTQAIQVYGVGEPDVLALNTMELPELASDQVRIALRAVGVNPVDGYIRAGINGYKPPTIPWTPGFDGAGVVEAVGKDITKFKVGQRVFVLDSQTGTYATHIIANQSQVYPLPDSMSFVQGACLGVPATSAMLAIDMLSIKAGSTLLVRGASGAVGMAAVQIGVALGLTVYGTASTEEGRRQVVSAGASGAYTHDADSIPSCNAVIEMQADKNLQRDIDVLLPGGKIVIVGSASSSTQLQPRQLMALQVQLHGIMLWKTSLPQRHDIHRRLKKIIDDGKLTPVIAHQIPLENVWNAHQLLASTDRKGKIVLTVNEKGN